MFRARLAPFLALVLASPALAATVTYTLSLNEGVNGQCTANSFAIYATVGKGDNTGLFGFLTYLKTPAEGGATLTGLVNRSPTGSFSIDTSDEDFDPDVAYPMRWAGFGNAHLSDLSRGFVSGQSDLARGADLIRTNGLGQQVGNMDDFRPPPFANPYESPKYPGEVSYKPYHGENTTDVAFGSTGPALVAGSLRLAVGAWSGSIKPAFNLATPDHRANVWTDPADFDHGPATITFRTIDFCAPPPLLSVSLDNSARPGSLNMLDGGGSLVVAQARATSLRHASPANAPISSIGDESGNIYVMAKLSGSDQDIATVMGLLTSDVDASDPQYSRLHQLYDPSFGAGGFNALFKFPNIEGSKVFNWDFGYPVKIDRLAVVPEPAMAGLVFAFAAIWRTRRRGRSTAVTKMKTRAS